MESRGAKGKIRGTAGQLVERYLEFAEEARLAHDTVAVHAFLQSAEHYVRQCPSSSETSNHGAKRRAQPSAPASALPSRSEGDTPTTVAEVAVVLGQRPDPEPIPAASTVEGRAIEKEPASLATRRALAAAEIERVAGQHGYRLAELGLDLPT